MIEFPGDSGLFHDLTYDPSGTQLALVNGGSSVTLWDARTGQRRRLLVAECGPIRRIAYSRCGKWLAIAARDSQVHVFDAQTLLLNHKFSLDSPVSGLAFGSGGTLAAIAADASARFWDAATAEVLWTLPPRGGHRQTGLALHPDGTRVAVAIGGEGVTLWDLAHRQRFLALRKQADVAGLVTFSPNGTYIASATGDGMIRGWSSSVTSSADDVCPDR